MIQEEYIKFWNEEVGRPPKIPQGNKCFKRQNGYSFYAKCTCGMEWSLDSRYYNDFNRCPKCGAKCMEKNDD